MLKKDEQQKVVTCCPVTYYGYVLDHGIKAFTIGKCNASAVFYEQDNVGSNEDKIGIYCAELSEGNVFIPDDFSKLFVNRVVQTNNLTLHENPAALLKAHAEQLLKNMKYVL
ncbi:MAG: hypothetical protein ACK56I_36270, partial [bacterium]